MPCLPPTRRCGQSLPRTSRRCRPAGKRDNPARVGCPFSRKLPPKSGGAASQRLPADPHVEPQHRITSKIIDRLGKERLEARPDSLVLPASKTLPCVCGGRNSRALPSKPLGLCISTGAPVEERGYLARWQPLPPQASHFAGRPAVGPCPPTSAYFCHSRSPSVDSR